MPPKFLFLGVGNRDRGDDAVGPRVAEKLAADPVFQRLNVDILSHGGEGASLMDLWQGTRKTVIVDAMKSGAVVGTVRRIDANADRLESGVFHYSSHLFGVAEAVEMARQLDRLPEALVIFGIEGRIYDFGAPLSPEVESALEDVTVQVKREFADA